MTFEMLMITVVLAALIAGAYTDIKKREVPDWVNYGLIAAGLGSRLVYSFDEFDWSYIIEGVLGFAAFFAVACLMFYAGQWGGGDAKMMMGLGSMLGLRLDWMDFSISFIVNIFLAGALYGLIWSFALAYIHRHRFRQEIKKLVHRPNMIRMRKIIIISAVTLFILAFLMGNFTIKLILFALVVFYLLTFYLWILIKAVEKSCLYRMIGPEKLTEGDWVAKDVIVGGKRICGPDDLGIEMKQIRQLIALKRRHRINRILIKEGIPFVPSFLLAFILTLMFGNLFLMVMA